jgi:hypothetical protein
MAMDGQYVYVGMNDSGSFYVLSRKDLSEVRRLMVQGRVSRFLPRGDKLVVQTNVGATIFLRIGDFSVIDTPASRDIAANRGIPSWMVPVDLGDGLSINGIVFNSDLEKFNALTEVEGLKSIGAVRGGRGSAAMYTMSRWGLASNSSGALMRPGGQSFGGNVSSIGSMILLREPMAVSLSMVNRQPGGNGSGGSIVRGELAFRDLVTGSVQQPTPIFDEWLPTQAAAVGYVLGNYGPQMREAAGKVYVMVADRLYWVDVPPADPARFPRPLQIAADQGVVVLAADRPTTIRFRSLGGSGTVQYAMAREVPGVNIEMNGTMTIQPGTWVNQAVDVLSDTRPRVDAVTGEEIERQDLASYQKAAAGIFKALTGREAKGIPVAISISVTAKDVNLQMANAERALLLEVPVEMVQQRINAPQIEAARVEAMGKRVETLGQRIDSLEAKIDLLTKALNDTRSK